MSRVWCRERGFQPRRLIPDSLNTKALRPKQIVWRSSFSFELFLFVLGMDSTYDDASWFCGNLYKRLCSLVMWARNKALPNKLWGNYREAACHSDTSHPVKQEAVDSGTKSADSNDKIGETVGQNRRVRHSLFLLRNRLLLRVY